MGEVVMSQSQVFTIIFKTYIYLRVLCMSKMHKHVYVYIFFHSIYFILVSKDIWLIYCLCLEQNILFMFCVIHI